MATISARAGRPLVKPKMYQNKSHSHTSNRKKERDTAPAACAAVAERS